MSDTNDPQQGAREGTRPDAPNNVDSKVEPQGAAEANRPGTPDNLGSELEQRSALERTRPHAPGTVPSKVKQEGARSEALQHVHARAAQLRRNARANYRTMEGWQRVRTPEDWERTVEESLAAYESGKFFLDRAGAERFVDPKLMATLLSLRQGLLGDARVPTAEKMFVDMIMITFQHIIRVNGWIGDLMQRIEHDFFGDDAFTELAREGWRKSNRQFSVEVRVRRLSEQLLPVLDRLNRMLIRNQTAIKELRQGQIPAVAIQVGQHVTVTNRPNQGGRRVKKQRPQPVSGRDMRVTEATALEAGGDTPRAALSAAPAADWPAEAVDAGHDRQIARSSPRASGPRRCTRPTGAKRVPESRPRTTP